MVTNLAFFFKQRGARRAPRVELRHPLRCGRSLFAVRSFALGMALAAVAWLLHVAAMALAPLSDVQVVLAGGVVLVGVMAERFFGLPVSRRQWLGLALTATGLAAFALSAPTVRGAHASFSPAAMIGFEAALCGLGALLIGGRRAGAPAEHRGAMVGAASGILFGVSDLSIKALTGIAGAHGPLGLLSPWLLLALAAALVAFFSSARSFQEGEPVAVIAITTAAANVSSIAGGILVFGDPMPGSASAILAQSLGIAAILLATLLMPALGARERGLAPA